MGLVGVDDAAPVRLSLLGGFELRRDGVRLALQPAAQRLLALLALRDRPVRRSLVAATLWPDTLDERAAANLRSALWRLRRPECGVVQAHGQDLLLDPAVWVDTRELEGAASGLADDVPGGARLNAALLGAQLLPDWWDEWVLLERERFRQIGLHALERLCEGLAAGGRWAESLQAGLAAVAAEPLRESAHRLVIGVHLAEGNRGEALRQYDAYRRLLYAELRLRPSPLMEDMVAPLLRA